MSLKKIFQAKIKFTTFHRVIEPLRLERTLNICEPQREHYLDQYSDPEERNPPNHKYNLSVTALKYIFK